MIQITFKTLHHCVAMSPTIAYSWFLLLIAIINSSFSQLLKPPARFEEISAFLKWNQLFPNKTSGTLVGVFLLDNSSLTADDLITDWLTRIGYIKFSTVRIVNYKTLKPTIIPAFTDAIVFVDSFDANIKSVIEPLFDIFNAWKRETRFVFVFAKVFKESSDTLRLYLKLFWKQAKLLNCIVVCMDSFSTLQVLGYNPFKDEILNFTKQRNYFPAAFFPNKAKNLHGYKLEISYLIAPPYVYERNGKFVGKDYDFTMTFLKAINASVGETEQQSFFELSEHNGTIYDLAAQGLFLYEYTLGVAAYPHAFMEIVVLIKRAPLRSTTTTLLYMFDVSTWSFTFAFLTSFYGLKLCWLKMPFSDTPGQTPNLSLRILICAFSVFNIIMSQTFQSWITTFLIYPQREKDINTIDELVESKTQIYALDMWKNLLSTKLYDQYIFHNETRLFDGALSKRQTFVTTSDLGNLMSAQMQEESYHQVQEHVGTAYISYYLGTMSPYREVLNDIIFRSLAYGYSSKEWGGYEFTPETTKRRFKKLKPNHLQGVFLLWAVGLASSFLVFFVELYCYHYGRVTRVQKYSN